MSGLDLTEAVEAGHRALHTHYRHPDPDEPSYRSDVWIALRAAAPLIEAQVREQIAAELDAWMAESGDPRALGTRSLYDAAVATTSPWEVIARVRPMVVERVREGAR